DGLRDRTYEESSGTHEERKMTIAKFYILNANEGMGADLEAALKAMAGVNHLAPNVRGVDIYRDPDNHSRFYYFEKWPAIENHVKAGEWLAEPEAAPVNAVLKGMMAALSPDMEGSYVDYFKTGEAEQKDRMTGRFYTLNAAE